MTLAPLRGTGIGPAHGRPVQPALDEIGVPLHEVTFVVVDLETTGGTPATSAITEIGAVKVRGGEVLGEFQTLVDPCQAVPAFIARLTGITNAMVATAPTIELVLPSFIEFARNTVLVAHNAPFDVGFLRAAYREAGYEWPRYPVVDTVALARKVVPRDEAPNHKLSTLARLFGATVTPEHRALADARATVDVLHALLGRLGSFGVTHLEDLASAADPVPPDVRRKRHLADGLPDSPGVYMFRGPGGEVLYVGTSTSIRKRVRSYFTRAEKRTRITEMVRIAESVTPVPCATVLEAQVRELRLIAQHAPRYNRRSTHPERMPWVRLTDEPYPRLSIVRDVAPGAAHIGPFSSQRSAKAAVEALHDALPIRRCSTRLPRAPRPDASACALAGMGRCPAPCVDPGADYDAVTARARQAMEADPEAIIRALTGRIASLSRTERYEEAAEVTGRLRSFLSGSARAQRLGALASCRELVAATPTAEHGWQIVVIRHAKLAATAIATREQDPVAVADALIATAEEVPPPTAPAPAGHPHEAELLLSWLDEPGVRLVRVTDPIAFPLASACAWDADRTAAAVAERVREEEASAARLAVSGHPTSGGTPC